MPAIKLNNVAAGTANALDGLKFQQLPGPSLVSVYGSAAVAGGNIDFAVDSEDFLKGAQLNIEASADVVDVQRDILLDREPMPAGKMFLAVNDQICNVLVVIESV